MEKDIFENDITIVACGKNEHMLCDKLSGRYDNTEAVGAIRFSQLTEDIKSCLFIYVGDIDKVDISILPATVKWIDLTDKKIEHLLNSENNIENIRTQIIDGIVAPYLGSLIGIDIVDIVNLINSCDTLKIGLADSKGALDIQKLISNVILSSGVDILKCKSIYMSICGDIGIIEGNEIVENMEEVVGEDNYIVWSVIYDGKVENEYYVMALFME